MLSKAHHSLLSFFSFPYLVIEICYDSFLCSYNTFTTNVCSILSEQLNNSKLAQKLVESGMVTKEVLDKLRLEWEAELRDSSQDDDLSEDSSDDGANKKR